MIEQLNKILTNTMEYRNKLVQLADSEYDFETKKKILEFAEVRKVQYENLMHLISNLGGQVETSGRVTDQYAVSWLKNEKLKDNSTVALLNYLIEAESNCIKDYEKVMSGTEFTSENRELLSRHREEATATLHYLESALASQEGT